MGIAQSSVFLGELSPGIGSTPIHPQLRSDFPETVVSGSV